MKRGSPSSCLLVIPVLLAGGAAPAQEKTTYQDHVLPLVEQHCSKCHNADKKKADLELTSYPALLKGGGSGAAVASGNPEGSLLWKVLTHAEEPFMPPERPKLPEKDLAVFRKWIAGGLLEKADSKSVVAAKPAMDLSMKVDATGKPDGPPPMPREWPLEPVVHTARGNPITGLASSPWAPVVAVAGQKQILAFHSDTLELLGILPFGEGQPEDVHFSRTGKLLLAAGGERAKKGRVALWNVESGEKVSVLGDEYDSILSADIRPDQSQVALGGPSRLVKLFSTRSGEPQHKIKKHTDWVTAIAYSPNGEFLATGDRNGAVILWDPDNAQELFTFSGHKSGITALAWRGDSKILASASEDGTVKWWETAEGKQAKTWTAHNGGVLSVRFAHDGRMVTCGRDNAVTLWKPDGTKARALEFTGELPLRAVFSHDGKRVFTSDFTGRVAAWNVEDGKRLAKLNANPAPLAEQIAAAEKAVADAQSRVAESNKIVTAAFAAHGRAAAALAEATNSLATARADHAAQEQAVVVLKELATNAPPPDIDARLATARAVRQKAREAVTNATVSVGLRTKELAAAGTKLAQARADLPSALLTQATDQLARLKAAQTRSAVFRARESLASKKREQERVVSVVVANKDLLKKAEKDLAAAKTAAARAEEQIKSARSEIERYEPAAQKLTSEIEAEQVRLKQLTGEKAAPDKPSVPPALKAKL